MNYEIGVNLFFVHQKIKTSPLKKSIFILNVSLDWINFLMPFVYVRKSGPCEYLYIPGQHTTYSTVEQMSLTKSYTGPALKWKPLDGSGHYLYTDLFKKKTWISYHRDGPGK